MTDTTSIAPAPPVQVIATHDGSFHADDVFGVAILRVAVPHEKGGWTRVLRTRDPSLLATANFLVDVGGEHDGENKFDHHQRGGAGSRDTGIPYASAGLVWARYGISFLQAILPAASNPERLQAWERIDRTLISPLDAIDNGVALGPQVEMGPSALVGQCNPTWLAGFDTGEAFQAAFHSAAIMATSILINACHDVFAQIRARERVLEAYREQKQGAPILVIEQPGMPWSETVALDLPAVLLVVYPAGVAENPSWHVQAAPATIGTFDNRMALPLAWAGLRGDELSEVTGIPGCVFAHNGRWIAGHRTRAGAVALAELALAQA